MKRIVSIITMVGVVTCSFYLSGEDSTSIGENEDDEESSSGENIDEEDCCDFELPAEVDIVKMLENAVDELGFSEQQKSEFIGGLRQAVAQGRTEEEEKASIKKGLKTLEGLIPELLEISSTWETSQWSTIFRMLTVSIARHYNLADRGVELLSETIDKFILAVPEQSQGLLDILLEHYSIILVEAYDELQDKLSILEIDAEEMSKEREEILEVNPNTNTRHMDTFLSCVESVRKSCQKEFLELFQSLRKSLEEATVSIDKMKNLEDKDLSTKNIRNTIKEHMTKNANKIFLTTTKITARNCYLGSDIEKFRSD